MYAITADELLNFSVAETERWHDWFSSHPQTLDFPIDIAQAKTVRELVLHIVAVELRYAERLMGKPVTDYNQLPARSVEELFSISKRSTEMLRQFSSQTNDSEWAKVLTFPTRSAGTLSASKRKIFVHTFLHGMRHWAQLATFLRQQGHEQSWPHDFIFSNVIP
ncbi:MAG TPA: DinB family protein [Terriglobales bacterium]|nr:DinB family protein [Terriglobales bacterium]